MPDERARGQDGHRRRRPDDAGTTRRRTRREPRLSRTRSRSVVAVTTGWLGVSSTRRAAVLAIVVCAIALTVAVPLRNYVSQQQELAAVSAQQRALAAEVEELGRQRDRLSDPAEVQAQARTRLGYVRPGEVPYVVQLPPDPTADATADSPSTEPWYRRLWRDVSDGAP